VLVKEPGLSRLLVVVDVQVAMVTGDFAVPAAETFLGLWKNRIEEARAATTPVLFVQNDGEEPWDDAPGHPGWELYFAPKAGERTVRKTTMDVFESNPELAAELRSAGVTELELIGLQSELCVFESSKGALDAGFNVVLPAGFHATYDSEEAKSEAISAKIQDRLESLGAVRV
jgi:nicotinamidase-related amidase